MGTLAELLATGDRQALEFFFLRLRDVSGATVDPQELLYNASVLAHYALVSTQSQTDLAAPATLRAPSSTISSSTRARCPMAP